MLSKQTDRTGGASGTTIIWGHGCTERRTDRWRDKKWIVDRGTRRGVGEEKSYNKTCVPQVKGQTSVKLELGTLPHISIFGKITSPFIFTR